MAELVVEGEQLVVRLSWWEKIAAEHGNVRVPLSSVEYASVQARARGFLWYGSMVSYGRHHRYFVAARGRRAAVQVSLNPPSRFSWLLVTVADPEATATRIMDARDRHRGAEGKLLGQVQARRLWLPWRPRLRLIFGYRRALAYAEAPRHRFDRWLRRRFTGWLRPVMTGIVFLPVLCVRLIGWALVSELTIIAFGVSFCLVVAEWLLLALMFPVVAVARLASLWPWPLVAVAGPERWTARVAGWGASGKAAADAADALRSGAALAAPPWSPGARRAKIWTMTGMERMHDPGQMRQFTASVRWDYTVAELRQIAAGHDLRVTSRMRHDDLVSLITEAGISLPPKPLDQLPPYLRRGGPQA